MKRDTDISPPSLAEKFLKWFLASHLQEIILGDLHEEFAYNIKRVGEQKARWFYWWEVLGFIKPRYIKRQTSPYPSTSYLSNDMIRNYFKIALRNLFSYQLNSTLTITGLALGLACGLLIILHVKEELSYDKGFSKSNRIFRINSESLGEENRRWAATSPIIGIELKEQIPAVQMIARFHRPYPDRVLSYVPAQGDLRQFEEKNGFYADSTAVDMFDITFVKGDSRTALKQPDAIVMTEALAKKYFGDEQPVGKIIRDDLNKQSLTVTGVIQTFSFPTHLQFDYLISMSTIYGHGNDDRLKNRTWAGFYNYVLLKNNVSRQDVEARLPEFMVKFYAPKGETKEEILATRKMHLQRVTDIHLHSKLEKEMGPNSEALYVYVFSIAALFILLVASVNFINMATAQAFNRMKEVGVRKVLGARKGQLLKQFLGESFLLTLAATLLALLFFRLCLPFYNGLAAQNLHFGQLFNTSNIVIMVSLVGLISLIAGVYPAWFISSFEPVASLKGKKSPVLSVTLVRKSLIVFQFAVSVFMIFSTIVVYRQMQFFQNKKLGFDKEQVVAVKLYGREMFEKANTIKNELLKNSSISEVALISTLPGDRFSTENLSPVGNAENEAQMRFMWVDENTLPLLHIPLKAGRNFTKKPQDASLSFILNEAAVEALKLDSPVGQKVVYGADTGEVAGIVKDFHFASLHSSVDPLVIVQQPNQANYFLLKIKGDNLKGALQFAERRLAHISPGSLFTYRFLDEKLASLYDSEQRMGNVMKAFAVFTIFISCLGLFGLSVYAAQLRTKEIGIRKVLGATVPGITVLLSMDFLQLVLIAVVLASPLAWWAMSKWLEAFAYRIVIEWWVFVLTGVITVLIAVLTISFQSIKAALLNPVKSLQSE